MIWNPLVIFRDCPTIFIPLGSVKEDFFSLFVDTSFCKMVTEETNKFAENWKDKNAEEVEPYIYISSGFNNRLIF
jgi:hypothetical protein